jgi:hypothetical protein
MFLDRDVLLNRDVLLDREFTAAGAIRLISADITGQLSCRDAKLTGQDNNGNALVGDRLKVGGGMFLDQKFTAAGAIGLAGADITGQLSCRDAKLTGQDNDGDTLVGDGMKVWGSMFLDQSTAAGAIRLPGADIAGQLSCRDAKLTGKDNDGNTLVGFAMKVGEDVFLDQSTAAGKIVLRSVHVSGSVYLRPAALAGSGEVALDATGAQIMGSLVWAPDSRVSGLVKLEGATVGYLVDHWDQDRPSGFWPTRGAASPRWVHLRQVRRRPAGHRWTTAEVDT